MDTGGGSEIESANMQSASKARFKTDVLSRATFYWTKQITRIKGVRK